jgi:ubiquinone/menaquinone biosynthesis C-methylase UbiE
MSHQTMEAHYQPNWNLTQAHGLLGYNCGYAESSGCDSFDLHQQSLVWRLLGDTAIDGESTMLDVGCGIGGPSTWIARRFSPKQILSIEYCWSSVLAAGRRPITDSVRPRFLQGDAHSLPVADKSIDVIFNLESALHYADKRRFISECHRALRPGGTLCLGDITTTHKLLFAPVSLLNSLPSQFNSNVTLWSADDYKAAFAQTGFELGHHEEASQAVARSLRDGLSEVRRRGWAGSRGFRGRILFLAALERLFRTGLLRYDLFRVTRGAA